MRTIIASILIVSALPFASLGETEATPDPVTGLIPTQQAIERLELRIKQKPKDFLTLMILGQLQVRQARETGNLDAYKRAGSAFEAALVAYPDYMPAMEKVLPFSCHCIALARHVNSHGKSSQPIMRVPPGSPPWVMPSSPWEISKLRRKRSISSPMDQTFGPRRAELARIRGDSEEALRLLLRAAVAADFRGEVPENLSWYRWCGGNVLSGWEV